MKKKLIFMMVLALCSLNIYAQAASAADTAASDELNTRVQLAMSNADYMVTAGDIYTLGFIVGSSTMEYHIIVDSTYKVRVANLAVIDANGKSFMTLKRQVEDIVSKNYPMSGVQFTLVKPAVFNVIVKGEVANTSEKQAWALSRLSSVVASTKNAYASIRNVTVTSTNGTSKHYDLFKASRNGDLSQDPYLRPGDVITLHKYQKRVAISGSVRRPGTYELFEDENLKELIEIYAGGFNERADINKITISRVTDASDKAGSVLYINNPLIAADFVLKNLDAVSIASLDAQKPVMYMEGAVLKRDVEEDMEAGDMKVEGSTRLTVRFNYDENYAYFIRSHAGYFTSSIADIQNAYIIRGGELISFDISKALYDPTFTTELIVQPDDILRVPMKQFFVSVSGSVHNPGRYPYVPNKTYDYYVGLAGGFIKTQNVRDAVEIVDAEGKKLNKNSEITPETTITADANSFLFYFNQYAPVVTTVLTIVSTTLSIMAVTGVLGSN